MKNLTLLALLSISMTFQSCFEIIEQLQLKNNGSGNFQLTLNLSKSKTKLNSIMKMETINGHPVPTKDDIAGKLKEITATMKATPGITNVKSTIDFDNFIGMISCDFLSINQLNKTIRAVKIKEKATGAALEDNYGYDATNKTFQRKNKTPFNEMYRKMTGADKEIFSNAGFTAIYKFESDITSTSNKSAKVSPGKKAVMISLPVLDIITQKKSIENNLNISR